MPFISDFRCAISIHLVQLVATTLDVRGEITARDATIATLRLQVAER